jgi:hypothetical protein
MYDSEWRTATLHDQFGGQAWNKTTVSKVEVTRRVESKSAVQQGGKLNADAKLKQGWGVT